MFPELPDKATLESANLRAEIAKIQAEKNKIEAENSKTKTIWDYISVLATPLSIFVTLLIALFGFQNNINIQQRQAEIDRQLQQDQAVMDFQLKALEIVMDSEGPCGTHKRARAIALMFPDYFPDGFDPDVLYVLESDGSCSDEGQAEATPEATSSP